MKETADFSVLVGRAREGDNTAFEELYRLTSKSAYHTASLLLKNPSDVEDVLQNVYLKVSLNLNELKNPEKFEGWVKTIVENESKNYIKKEKRINAPIVFLKNKSTEYSEEWNQPVPQEYMEREELRKSIGAVVDKLSPEIRACIVLFHYEDKSLNEISELLDLPLGTVKSRLHNGRKQIEKEFNKLRKKDPTLYSIAAIPALISFMAFQAENVTVPAALTQAVLSSAAAAGTGAAAASAAGAGAASAGGVASAASAASAVTGTAATAATSIAVKVAAVAVAGSVAVGGTAAIKNHVDNKAEKETTLAYASTMPEETCTVAETTLAAVITEIITTEESTSAESKTEKTVTQTASHTAASTTGAHTETTRKQTTKPVTTKKETTTRATTVRVTTTAPTTTEKITTTKKETTTEEETTQKPTTTRRPTTTATPTTSPENNYGTSGGVITEYTGSETNVSIPQSIGGNKVTAIGAGAFAGNTEIKSVSLPSGVTQIGQEAFADCTLLGSVSLPSTLKLVGIGAFYGCTALKSVSLPSGTETIGDEAFAGCSTLSSVTIPSSVTSIADNAFDGCDSLTIRCEENSAAHDYSVANSIDYVLI